jgi:secreted trypsin-like serine protease
MRKVLFAFAVAAATVFVASGMALAITYGKADGDRHPEVGALVGKFGKRSFPYCSGTLISRTVFLTAAHCEIGTKRVKVTFDEKYTARSSLHTGTFHASTLYPGATNDPYDIAVVVFDEPVKGIDPARLPARNRLADLPKDRRFTSVGYGSQEVTNAPGGHEFVYEDAREYSVGTLNSVTKSYLRISQNPATGNGGTCYGDSGGPNFLGADASETNVVASTTITGDSYCKSTNVTYRLDTRSSRNFLKDYVTLP